MKFAMKIKRGAIVFSDHSFPHWGEHIGVGQEDRLFKFDPLDVSHNRFDLRAHGFGLTTVGFGTEAYGNGSLFVSKDDVEQVEVTEEEYATIFKPAIPIVVPKKKKPGLYLVVGDGYSEIVKIKLHDGCVYRFDATFSCVREDYFNGDPHWYGPIDLHELMLLETAKMMIKSKLPIDMEKARNIYKELSNGLD